MLQLLHQRTILVFLLLKKYFPKCTNSNLYHRHCVELKLVVDPQYQDKSWSDIKLNQLKYYLGISIIMGINKLGRYRHFRSSNPHLGNEGIKKCMPIREYETIQSNLHICNRDQEARHGTPNYHKLGKVQWLTESLSHSFSKYNNPQREQSIDEGNMFSHHVKKKFMCKVQST